MQIIAVDMYYLGFTFVRTTLGRQGERWLEPALALPLAQIEKQTR